MNGLSLQRSDKLIISAIILVLLLFAGSESVSGGYKSVTAAHPLFAGFCKFAILATFGECLAARLHTGRYYSPDFGLIPKALVWGILGIFITLAFSVFSRGVPSAMASLFGNDAYTSALAGGISLDKVLVALGISVSLNLVFAPVMMLAHKLSDLHIASCGGQLRSLITKPDIPSLLRSTNWDILWSFVLAKTIPYFWIPAHTITFMLPEAFRVLFAALLGAALGVFLAWKK